MKFSLLPPALVISVPKLSNRGGMAIGPIAIVINKYKDDEGLIKHELEHVLQFWIISIVSCISIFGLSKAFSFNSIYTLLGLSVYWISYLLISKYRYWCELTAYTVQLKYSTDKERDILKFGKFIADSYELKVTKEEASAQLRKMNR